ncbi:MAG TPA: alpha/beta fold hydrolase [Actinomycetota bacterium]|nr:alpha/beta fold hydrolase [Actinomycetota bacterium]
MTGMPLWEQRLRAPVQSLPRWSRERPDRCVYETNASGIWQVHVWDVVSGERRQVSDHPVGVHDGYPTSDGSEVAFWQEDTGDETGAWLVQPFEGGGSEPFLDGAPRGWNGGLTQRSGVVAAGISTEDGAFGVYTSIDGRRMRSIASSEQWLRVAGDEHGSDLAGLSADGSLLAIQHAEHGVVTHPALRIVEPGSGAVAAERGDGTAAVIATAWSPVPGDQRLAVTHEPEDRQRVAIWDVANDDWRALAVNVPGDHRVADWFPGAGTVVLIAALDGREELYRVDVATGAVTKIPSPPGSVAAARVRPDGTVWFQHTDGVRRTRVLDDTGAEPIAVDAPAPPGRPFHDWRYTNDRGDEVHGWIVEPDGEGPHPLMVFVHGGPHWLYVDEYMPEVQAYVDQGFLVAMPNYRGSTGYGRAWRDALTGDPGFTDVDDVTAGVRDLRTRADVDPTRTVVAGWSWGGYIALMELGRNPDLWTAGVAGIPVGDYVRAYAEEAPALQAMDRALFGGTPDDKPDLYERASPITYADAVVAPVLFVIGENDSRCPLGQALAYVDQLAGRDAPHEVYRFSTGHGSAVVDEDVRQIRAILAFLHRTVPGLQPV